MGGERETKWQGDPSFGAGFGNQTPEADPAADAAPATGAPLDGDPGDYEIKRSSAARPSLLDPGHDWDRRIKARMEVIGSDGVHVGTVDALRGEHLVLTKSDEAAGGVHHQIPFAWIASADGKVRLNLPAAQARANWREEGGSRALYERENAGRDGPGMLDRSFSGTYSDKK